MDAPFVTSLVRSLHLLIRKHGYDELIAAGHTDLTVAHLYVFQTPGPDGVRPTELAARTNMTKQAMNHLLAGLERGGYLERVPSPTDGRGKVLHVTERGRDVERIIRASAARMERAWSDVIGQKRLEQLREVLIEVYDVEAGARDLRAGP